MSFLDHDIYVFGPGEATGDIHSSELEALKIIAVDVDKSTPSVPGHPTPPSQSQ